MEEFAYDPTTDLHPVLQNMDTLLKSGRLRPDSLLMQLNARMVDEAYMTKCSWSKYPALFLWTESMAFLGGTRALEFMRGRSGIGTGSVRYSSRTYSLDRVNLPGDQLYYH